jgi:hypothetical protein
MTPEFSDIGSIKALLDDARQRIKESEERCTKKIDEAEVRLNKKIYDLEISLNTINVKILEWLPLITNLSKSEDNKRNITISLVVIFVTNIVAWIFTAFVFFVKTGVMK